MRATSRPSAPEDDELVDKEELVDECVGLNERVDSNGAAWVSEWNGKTDGGRAGWTRSQ